MRILCTRRSVFVNVPSLSTNEAAGSTTSPVRALDRLDPARTGDILHTADKFQPTEEDRHSLAVTRAGRTFTLTLTRPGASES